MCLCHSPCYRSIERHHHFKGYVYNSLDLIIDGPEYSYFWLRLKLFFFGTETRDFEAIR